MKFVRPIVALMLLAMPALAETPATTKPETKPATTAATKPGLAECLSAEEAAKILSSDDPPYLSLLHPMEASGKTGFRLMPATLKDPAARLAELKKRYAEAAMNFTAAEIETLNWYIEKLDPLVADFPLYAKTPWRFIKVAPNIENGFSHTRGDCIVFTARTLGQLGVARKRSPDTAAYLAGGLLLHEKCHIVERQHPKLMADLFTTVWKFEHATVELGPWFSDRQLLNPDGTDLGWVYKLAPAAAGESPRYIMPMIAYADTPEDVPTNFSGALIAPELTKTKTGYTIQMLNDTKPRFTTLDKYPEYVKAFGDANSIYHPNEIFADLFAMMIAKDVVARSKIEPLPKDPPYGPLREWLKINFAKVVPPETSPAK